MASQDPGATRQIAAPALLCLAAGSLYAWSALTPALRARFEVGVAAAGQVFSLAIVSFSLAVLLAPMLPRRVRGLNGGAVAATLAAAATALASLAPSYPLFLVCFSFGFGAMSGAIYIFTLELAASSRVPAVATPLMVAAFGLGGVVFGPLLRWLVATGWQTEALLAVSLTLLATVAVVLLTGHESRLPASAEPVAAAERPGNAGALILLWLAFAFGSGAGLMVLGLAATLIEDRGASVGLSSLVLAGVAVGNTGGRLGVGLLAQVCKPAHIAGLSPLLGLIGLAMLMSLPDPRFGAVALSLVAASYGLMASAMPVLTRSIFGAHGFRRAFSIVFTGWGAAGLASPWVAGILHDATGSFDLAIVLAAGSCVVALLACGVIAAGGLASARRPVIAPGALMDDAPDPVAPPKAVGRANATAQHY